LFDQLAKAWQNEFAVLFDRFVCERAERIEENSSGPFIGLCGFGKCGLKFCFGHREEELRGCSSRENPTASTKSKAISLRILHCMDQADPASGSWE
jgi:hypothetical protein